MRKMRKARLALAVLAVLVVGVAVGDTVMASNMGFKANISIRGRLAGDAADEAAGLVGVFTGSEWIALPYNNPYTTVNEFCSQTGLVSTGCNQTLVSLQNGDTGEVLNELCGNSDVPLFKGQAVEIRARRFCTVGTPETVPTSLIIVGSHDPTFPTTLVVPDTSISASRGDYLWSIPYHTTASNLRALCVTTGVSGSGGFFTTLNPANGEFNNFLAVDAACSGVPELSLLLGRGLTLRDANAPHAFIAAHF